MTSDNRPIWPLGPVFVLLLLLFLTLLFFQVSICCLLAHYPSTIPPLYSACGFQFHFSSPRCKESGGCRVGCGNGVSQLVRCQISKCASLSFYLQSKGDQQNLHSCVQTLQPVHNTDTQTWTHSFDLNRAHSVGKMHRLFKSRLHTQWSFDHLFGCHQMIRLHLLSASMCRRIPSKASQLFHCNQLPAWQARSPSPSWAFFQASSVWHVTSSCVWCASGALVSRVPSLSDGMIQDMTMQSQKILRTDDSGTFVSKFTEQQQQQQQSSWNSFFYEQVSIQLLVLSQSVAQDPVIEQSRRCCHPVTQWGYNTRAPRAYRCNI